MLMEVGAKLYPIDPRLTHDTEISLSIRERNRINDNGLWHTIFIIACNVTFIIV